MSKKASTTVIGGFVVGALALVVAGVLIFGSGKFFSRTQKYVLFFEGSVKGLNVGAPVAFKGVKVGSVTDIKLLLMRDDLSLFIPVFVELEPERITESFAPGKSGGGSEPPQRDPEAWVVMSTLTERGLKAQLKMQSLLTGLLYVDLDFYPDKAIKLMGIESTYPELPTVPSDLEELSKTVQTLPLEEITKQLLLALQGIQEFINDPELKGTVVGLNKTFEAAHKLLDNVDSKVDPLATDVDKTLAETQKFLKNLDGRLEKVASDVQGAVKDTRSLVRNVDAKVAPLATGVDETLRTARTALKQAESTLASFEGMTADNSPLQYELTRALKNLSDAARSLGDLAESLERHPEALIRGKGR